MVQYSFLSKNPKPIPTRILELIGPLEDHDCMSQSVWEHNGIGDSLLVSEEFWDAIHSVRVLQSMDNITPEAQDELIKAKAFVYDIIEQIAIELHTDRDCNTLYHLARKHPSPCVTVYYEDGYEDCEEGVR